MPIAIEHTIQALQTVLQNVPLGTNIALLHLLWTMLNGSFLVSRGAIFPALVVSRFRTREVRRSWAAMRHGVWRIDDLLQSWRRYVLNEGQWQEHDYEGYRPVAVDLTTFWRPQLQGRLGKYYHRLANRALGGLGFGLVVQVGQIGKQRVPLLRKIIRAHPQEPDEARLKTELLQWTARHLAEQEVAVGDAGMRLRNMQTAGVPRFVVRLAKNCTARRNELPPRKQRGRPAEYGRRVRPLPRKRKGRAIAADEPDFQSSFQFQQRQIRVHGWRDLVRSDVKPDLQNDLFSILLFFDPLHLHPLVLGTNIQAQPESVFRLYLDRWPVEQPPLAAKQMLGLSRQFVFAPESCQRLPELALLAGNILTYLATVLPPMPTGFWDQRPKKRLVAYDASWHRLNFQKHTLFMGNFEKSSRLLHIYPKGLLPIGEKSTLAS